MIFVPNVSAQEATIPGWIKNNAGWWADGLIDDSSFVSGIQWLITNGIMTIPSTEQGTDDGVSVIPDWIKNNAGWWANGQIDDSSFVSGIQWLITNGMIVLEPVAEVEQLDFEPGEGLELNCSIEIDKDGDGVPDNLDVVGSIDWSNCNLMRLDLSNFELSGANLSGANLYEANLSGANLSGANLSHAQIYKAKLINTDFTYADLSYTNLCGAISKLSFNKYFVFSS